MRVRPFPAGLAALAFVLTMALIGAAASTETAATRRDAAAMKQKVASISALGERPSKQLHRTMVTENEVNAYLAQEIREGLPTGVVDPSVSILGPGRLFGRAVVDLDAVRTSRTSTSLFDPRAYLIGHLPV